MIFIFVSGYQFLYAQSTDCSRSDIYSVNSLIDSKNPQLGTFKYFFQYKKKGDPQTPTVIIIPGGPGGTSISLQPDNPYFDWDQILYGLPKNYNAILTDPRSRGCNTSNIGLTRDSFTSRNVANDIVAIIQSLKLDNYIVYGHSYGTVVATLIGRMATENNIPKPRAIILSGTVGRHFKNHRDEVEPYYYLAWGNVRNHLPEQIKLLFPKNNDWSDFSENFNERTILDISIRTWYNFTFSNLTEGGVYSNGKLNHPFLQKLLLLDGHDEKALSELKAEVLTYVETTSNNQINLKPFHDSIWCQELEEHQGPECTAQNLSFTNPYDSATFQISGIPLIYIQGEYDSSVPINQASYHYLHQTSNNKYFVIAKDGGHSTTATVADCKDSFWNSIFNEAVDFEKSIKNCIGLELRNPK